MAKSWRKLLFAALLLGGAAGCRSVAPPDIFDPLSLLSVEQQQVRANRYDPYGETDVGPSISETRPPGFSRPPVEPSRARWTRALGGVPGAGW
jgi:hypothetical protein